MDQRREFFDFTHYGDPSIKHIFVEKWSKEGVFGGTKLDRMCPAHRDQAPDEAKNEEPPKNWK